MKTNILLIALFLLKTTLSHYEPNSRIIDITTLKELKSIIRNNPKVIMLFSAKWCGCCQHAEPIYKEVSLEYREVTFVKIDVDESEALSDYFDIDQIPDFFGVYEGKDLEVDKKSGRLHILKFLLEEFN